MFWAKQIARAALLLATPLMVGATGLTTNWQGRVVAAQNRERALLGLEPLYWDDTLATTAQGWADHLAQTGAFTHAPRSREHPEGENLWMGTAQSFSAEDMTGYWLAEKRHFQPGVFPYSSKTGRFADVGHYTQIVWRRTRAVGCALAHNSENDILVCRYSQPGNVIGQSPY